MGIKVLILLIHLKETQNKWWPSYDYGIFVSQFCATKITHKVRKFAQHCVFQFGLGLARWWFTPFMQAQERLIRDNSHLFYVIPEFQENLLGYGDQVGPQNLSNLPKIVLHSDCCGLLANKNPKATKASKSGKQTTKFQGRNLFLIIVHVQKACTLLAVLSLNPYHYQKRKLRPG